MVPRPAFLRPTRAGLIQRARFTAALRSAALLVVTTSICMFHYRTSRAQNTPSAQTALTHRMGRSTTLATQANPQIRITTSRTSRRAIGTQNGCTSEAQVAMVVTAAMTAATVATFTMIPTSVTGTTIRILAPMEAITTTTLPTKLFTMAEKSIFGERMQSMVMMAEDHQQFRVYRV